MGIQLEKSLGRVGMMLGCWAHSEDLLCLEFLGGGRMGGMAGGEAAE